MPESNVIITGSSGLIGHALLQRLAGPYRVFGLDLLDPPEPLPERAKFHKLDLSSDQDVKQVMARVLEQTQGELASVIHLAAYYDFSGEPSDKYEQITVRGTERLLRALGKARRVEQFIFSSTMLVHAPTEPGRPITTDSPIEAKWDYPQSKVDTERVVRELHGDIPTLLLRIAGVYTDACDSVPIAQQIRRIYEKQMTSHVFPGDLAHGQALIHRDDLIDALGHAVDRRAQMPPDVTPLLVGEPQTYSYGELQRRLGQLIYGEEDWTTEPVPKTLAKAGAWVQENLPGVKEPFIKPWMIDLADDHYELDISQTEDLLHWTPQHRLIDTLPSMVAALKADPVGWYKRHKLEPPSDLEENA